MGRNQTEFGEVGAKAVEEVAVEKNIANWGDGKHAHTDTRHLLNIRGILGSIIYIGHAASML
jgi:hypothetical protein